MKEDYQCCQILEGHEHHFSGRGQHTCHHTTFLLKVKLKFLNLEVCDLFWLCWKKTEERGRMALDVDVVVVASGKVTRGPSW